MKQLFEAALEGRLDEVRKLAPSLSSDRLSDVRDANGRTVLHFAAQGGSKAATQYLLDAGKVDVNIKDYSGILKFTV